MSYPPPPGLRPPQSPAKSPTQNPHSSLPPRPPPSATNAYTHAKSHAPYGLTFQPRSISAQTYSHGPVAAVGPAAVSTSATPYASFTHPQQPINVAFPNSQQDGLGAPGAMPIQNPFPLPGQSSNDRNLAYGHDATDPELEAQIAQWQSAYAGKDNNNNNNTTTARNYGGSKWSETSIGLPVQSAASSGLRQETHSTNNGIVHPDSGVAEVVTAPDGKQKTVVRQGGGQSWQDPSLLEWDPAHFRLFVGNLAGEVTDDSLLKAFTKYSSIQKARVIRDKRTTKSKGYGFVSFSDGDDYFQAARDMQGKYIGSHPVLLRKSTTEIRPTIPRNQTKGNRRGKNGPGSASTNGSNSSGIHKKQNKNRNGLKLLG